MIVLRLRGQHHEIVREAVFRDLPVQIGRAPENHFVLLDDSVSAQHASLEREEGGRIVLRDLGSRNGIRLDKERRETIPVEGRITCLVGLVELEIEVADREITRDVPAAEWDHINRRRTFRHHVLYLALGTLGAAVDTSAKPRFWSPTATERWVELVQSGLFAVVALPLISLVVLIVLRAVGRKIRVADTLEAMALLAWLGPLCFAADILVYYFMPVGVGGILSLLVKTAASIYAVVHVASLRKKPKTWRFRILWGVMAGVLLLAYEVTKSYAAKERGIAATDYIVRPPLAGMIGPSSSLEKYFDDVSDQAEDASAEARRRWETRQKGR